MEVVEKEGIKVPNAVLVSGLSFTHVDEEVFDFLKQYGSVRRVIKIDDPESEFHKQAILEFESGAAVQVLEAVLPLDRPSSVDPLIIHHVRTLSSVYSANVGTSVTHTFLSELKGIAKLSGKSFADILQDELNRIKETFHEPTPEGGAKTIHEITPVQPLSEIVVTPSHADTAQPGFTPAHMESPLYPGESKQTTGGIQFHSEPAATPATSVRESMHNFNLTPDHLSTPEVQRVVVEHIVRSSDIASQIHSPAKLRSFSGKVPCPHYEVDYDTWRASVDFYLTDPSVSPSQLVRRMVDSLLPPAANVVKPLGPQATPHAYLTLLDSAYATVEDGDELFAKFLSTHQNYGEKPSIYLHRLQSSLTAVVRKKVVSPSDADKQLLKQFCRGCWDNALIATLQLEQKQNNPPTFAEFLLLLRVEEDKQAAKANRMKQHLGVAKAKVQSNTQAAYVEVTDYDTQVQENCVPSEVEQIKKQIANLQSQILALSVTKGERSVKHKTQKGQKHKFNETQLAPQRQSPVQSTVPRPKPWYCFKCGEDGHIATNCSNPPNPTLVDAKRKELKEKQLAWDKKTAHDTLN